MTLGTKTITCDNVNAVKPFGAIDTPTQGGIATGSNFVVWGWALTPLPNSIPTDGSTISVLVELELNLKDAYLMMAMDDIPETYMTKEITL